VRFADDTTTGGAGGGGGNGVGALVLQPALAVGACNPRLRNEALVLFISFFARLFGRVELFFVRQAVGVHARLVAGRISCLVDEREGNTLSKALEAVAEDKGAAAVLSVYWRPGDEKGEAHWQRLQAQPFVRGKAEEQQQAASGGGHMERRQCGLHLRLATARFWTGSTKGRGDAGRRSLR
jgi:hypothetical protein